MIEHSPSFPSLPLPPSLPLRTAAPTLTFGVCVRPCGRQREYAIFFGALVATLTELHEPLGINDNLTIPLFSSLAMQLAFYRTSAC